MDRSGESSQAIAPPESRIRVLVVDDSAFMRFSISKHLSDDPAIEVVGTARDGLDALEKVAALRPDVLTMDVEMPRLNGLGTLERLMQEHPTPVIMLSALTGPQTAATIQALELGAVDVVPKPDGTISLALENVAAELKAKVKAAARARLRAPYRPRPVEAAPARPAVLASPPIARLALSTQKPTRVVVIGSSTGGPRALQEVVPQIPAGLGAAYLIVQHMPAGFTRSLAERLDKLSALTVQEARPGDRLAVDLALVAPGGYHLTVDRSGRIRLITTPPVNGVRPAIDVTLESVAECFGEIGVTAILTGMGSDGTRGAVALRRAGGRVMAEDESTCVVYGMPKSVAEAGVVEAVVPLQDVARELTGWLQTQPASSPVSNRTRL